MKSQTLLKFIEFIDKEIEDVEAQLNLINQYYSRRNTTQAFLEGRLFELKKIKDKIMDMLCP